MHFTKMHGIGNDYLYVLGEVPDNAPELSIKLSERHFGVDSDGMIWISKSGIADFKMRIFNADGSGVTMACGIGACASAMAAVSGGLCEYNTPITVHLDGGDLTILVAADNSITMTGSAEFVYEGDTEICLHRT